MRQLPASLKEHLETGVTTVCQCWLLERETGEKLGFTDHDQMIEIEGVQCLPQSGWTASEAASNLGLGVDTTEVEGALQSDQISASSLARGDYDNAKVSIFLVNWQEPDQYALMRVAEIGEVTTEDGVFRAELRSVMHRLNQVQGRIFEFACDADVGDGRCGVNLNSATYRASGSVTKTIDNVSFTVSGLSGFDASWFNQGLLTWQAGANSGKQMEVQAVVRSGSTDTVHLWLPMPDPIAVSDTFQVTAGCDKQFGTCRAKFGNSLNYRGFPHIPGNDYAYSFARAGQSNSGDPIIE